MYQINTLYTVNWVMSLWEQAPCVLSLASHNLSWLGVKAMKLTCSISWLLENGKKIWLCFFSSVHILRYPGEDDEVDCNLLHSSEAQGQFWMCILKKYMCRRRARASHCPFSSRTQHGSNKTNLLLNFHNCACGDVNSGLLLQYLKVGCYSLINMDGNQALMLFHSPHSRSTYRVSSQALGSTVTSKPFLSWASLKLIKIRRRTKQDFLITLIYTRSLSSPWFE